MPDLLSSSAEHLPPGADMEKMAVCTACKAERGELLAELAPGKMESTSKAPSDIETWVETSFPTLEPRNFVAAAVHAFQEEEREFDPAYDVTQEAPFMIEADIRLYVEQMSVQRRNANTNGQIDDGVPTKIPVEAGEESAELVRERGLVDENGKLLVRQEQETSEAAKQAETTVDREVRANELEALQITFNQLQADGVGTVEALRRVIANAENSETKQHLNALQSRVIMLQAALPNKPEVVNRLLNTAGLNLAATTVVGSFEGFMSAAENDDALTDDDRAILQQVIAREAQYARTGSDVQAELGQTLPTVDGKIIPAHPENKPFQFRDHVQGFARTDGRFAVWHPSGPSATFGYNSPSIPTDMTIASLSSSCQKRRRSAPRISPRIANPA